jgi:hypothetical protein
MRLRKPKRPRHRLAYAGTAVLRRYERISIGKSLSLKDVLIALLMPRSKHLNGPR